MTDDEFLQIKRKTQAKGKENINNATFNQQKSSQSQKMIKQQNCEALHHIRNHDDDDDDDIDDDCYGHGGIEADDEYWQWEYSCHV